jgi:predicted HicB family RNase H-like nuclease
MMKKIIDGVTYNTATSTTLAVSRWRDEHRNTDNEATLYVTRLGAYFLDIATTGYRREQYEDGYIWAEKEATHDFEPMTADDAQKWLMESKADIHYNPFGDTPEAAAETGTAASVYLRIPAALKEQIDAAAKAAGQSRNEWAIRCFEGCVSRPTTLETLLRSDLGRLLPARAKELADRSREAPDERDIVPTKK